MLTHFYYGVATMRDVRNYIFAKVKNILISYATLFYNKNMMRVFDWKWDSVWIDSGGFQFFMRFSEYPYTPIEYTQKLVQLHISRKQFDYFATMDYPCEPEIIRKRRSTVQEHIEKTVENTLAILEILENSFFSELKEKFVPVVQGYNVDEYMYCIDLYKEYGLISKFDYFAVGSVYRRRSETAKIVSAIAKRLSNKKLHVFGIKISELRNRSVFHNVYSADSHAYTFNAMFTKYPKNQFSKRIRHLDNDLRYLLAFLDFKKKIEQIFVANKNYKLEKFLDVG